MIYFPRIFEQFLDFTSILPTSKFSSIYTDDRTPIFIIPPIIRVNTIETLLQWVSSLNTPIIVGFPMKRTRLRTILKADRILSLSAKSDKLPSALETKNSWFPFLFQFTNPST